VEWARTTHWAAEQVSRIRILVASQRLNARLPLPNR
jgi:hypothetical protein